MTYMKHSTRSDNFRVLLQDEGIRGQVEELVEAFQEADTEDHRGTRLREASLFDIVAPRQRNAKSLKKLTLKDDCLAALIVHLNGKAGQELYIDVREIRRIPGTQQLTNVAFQRQQVSCSGVSFLSDAHSPKDSNVMFRSTSSPNSVTAGRIKEIFMYMTPDCRGKLVEAVYLYVTPLAELTKEDATCDPYRSYNFAEGRLFYDRYLAGVVITPGDVMSHFARTPLTMSKISEPCIHVLSLDKVCSYFEQSLRLV